MDHNDSGARAERFAAYLADLASVLGNARRHGPLRSCHTGFLMPADRKSVEPMAAMTAPERTAAQHQSMLHFVGQGDWSDDAVLQQVRAHVVPAISAHGAVTACAVSRTPDVGARGWPVLAGVREPAHKRKESKTRATRQATLRRRGQSGPLFLGCRIPTGEPASVSCGAG